MEVSSSTNPSQSLALAAYSAQQQQGVARPRPQENDNRSVDPLESSQARRGDNVSFSTEALRLSTQSSLDSSQNRDSVARGSESETANRQQQQAANPEQIRAEGAKSVAQAINAYRDTSVI